MKYKEAIAISTLTVLSTCEVTLGKDGTNIPEQEVDVEIQTNTTVNADALEEVYVIEQFTEQLENRYIAAGSFALDLSDIEVRY